MYEMELLVAMTPQASQREPVYGKLAGPLAAAMGEVIARREAAALVTPSGFVQTQERDFATALLYRDFFNSRTGFAYLLSLRSVEVRSVQ